jgi:hypothetical protein
MAVLAKAATTASSCRHHCVATASTRLSELARLESVVFEAPLSTTPGCVFVVVEVSVSPKLVVLESATSLPVVVDISSGTAVTELLLVELVEAEVLEPSVTLLLLGPADAVDRAPEDEVVEATEFEPDVLVLLLDTLVKVDDVVVLVVLELDSLALLLGKVLDDTRGVMLGLDMPVLLVGSAVEEGKLLAVIELDKLALLLDSVVEETEALVVPELSALALLLGMAIDDVDVVA